MSGRNRPVAALSLLRPFLAALASVPLCACAVSWHIGSLAPDDAPTGSITKRNFPSPLSPTLDSEDWRRARAALSVALDPAGNGEAVTWDNPATGAKGSFAPRGALFAKNDEICRAFRSALSEGGEVKLSSGSACRASGSDEWTPRELKPDEEG